MQAHRKEYSAQSFDRTVREVFSPIYPIIAQQILTKTQTNKGNCLDVGCGTGALGRAIAALSSLHITFFDQSPDMIDYAMDYAAQERLMHRSDFLVGDVHQLALHDATMDLVISRGSCPFWSDWEKAYREICRVLKKGGQAYIGGGFGNAELRSEIHETMRSQNPNWKRPFQKKLQSKRDSIHEIVQKLPITMANIIDDESGFWVHIIK